MVGFKLVTKRLRRQLPTATLREPTVTDPSHRPISVDAHKQLSAGRRERSFPSLEQNEATLFPRLHSHYSPPRCQPDLLSRRRRCSRRCKSSQSWLLRFVLRIDLHTAFDASLGPTLLLQDAIANYTTENDVSSAIKAKFETSYPST